MLLVREHLRGRKAGLLVDFSLTLNYLGHGDSHVVATTFHGWRTLCRKSVANQVREIPFQDISLDF